MNWMDYESNMSNKLDMLELKGKLIEYILGRIKSLTAIKTTTEYEYTEILGRIKELELILNELKQTTNE